MPERLVLPQQPSWWRHYLDATQPVGQLQHYACLEQILAQQCHQLFTREHEKDIACVVGDLKGISSTNIPAHRTVTGKVAQAHQESSNG